MGNIVNLRYCPCCECRTYHRFLNPLRDLFLKQSRWICVECYRKELKRKKIMFATAKAS